MNSKVLACIAFLFNTVLFGTYYAISKEVLGRIDPILFTFFEMITLVPVALGMIIWTRRQITRTVLKRGFLLGSSLCLALFTIAIGLKYTTATCTAFFPSLGGFLAAFLAWMVLRHPIAKTTWIAGALSIIGTVLLIVNASMGSLRGSLIALLGGLFFTGYVFLSDSEQKDEHAPWVIFGIELLAMALWANLIMLLFGDWSAFHPQLPKDAWVILSVAGACTFLPTMITVLMQKYISPITISFIYILEPVFGAIVAFFYLHEVLPPGGYLGGGLIIAGAIIHTWGSAGASRQRGDAVRPQTRRPSFLDAQAMPALVADTCTAGKAMLGQHKQPVVIILPLTQLQRTLETLPIIIGVALPREHLSAIGCCSFTCSGAKAQEAFLHDRQQRRHPRIGTLMSKERTTMSQENDHLPVPNEAHAEPSAPPDDQQHIGAIDEWQYPGPETSLGDAWPAQESTNGVSHHPDTPLPETHVPPMRTRPTTRRIGLIAAMVALLVVAGAGLLPALFSAQPELLDIRSPAASVTTVGQVAFMSSGQLDASSSRGLNDIITVNLYHLAMPAAGQSYYAWLRPDHTDDTTIPLLLGRLSVAGGKTRLTYTHPDHQDLLTIYSGFEVTEQPSHQMPMTPPLDPRTWRYVGLIPNIPTPGDEQHYSLLSHLRHLLAQDPTLQHIGLQGGLDIWLYRNAEKILEWSSAARDSWAGGRQTDLIHRQMIRVLDYLDGAASVFQSGDLPPGSPLLVDPQAGRIGLLEVNQAQVLPAYLTHVDLHLQGLINAPGHTQTQKQLAVKIDKALKMDTSLFQHVHQDAVKLVRMSERQLKSTDALSLLNDMVTNANATYTGQFDPTIGGTANGIVWIHNELQEVATMAVTTPTQMRDDQGSDPF